MLSHDERIATMTFASVYPHFVTLTFLFYRNFAKSLEINRSSSIFTLMNNTLIVMNKRSKIFSLCLVFLNSLASHGAVIFVDISDVYIGFGNSYVINMDYSDQHDISFLGDGLTTLMPMVSPAYGRLACKTGSTTDLSALSGGTVIGSALNWVGNSGNIYMNGYTAPTEFPSGQNRYIGVRINKFGAIHYGWVLVQYTSTALIIKSYAYENTAGASITAGATSGGITTSIDEDVIETEVLMYPNPSNGLLHLKSPDKELINSNVKLTDLSGKYFTFESVENLDHEVVFDLRHLSDGIYYLYIETRDGILVKELILSR
jgi:hypothetical protein